MFILIKTNKKTGSVYSVVLTDQMTFFSMAPAHNFSRKQKVSSQVYGVGGGLEVTAGRGEQSSGPQMSVFPFSVMGDARRGALEPLSRAVIKSWGLRGSKNKVQMRSGFEAWATVPGGGGL